MVRDVKANPQPLETSLARNLVFVNGKGGVGKTAVSNALCRRLARNKRVLWVTFEDPAFPTGVRRLSSYSHLNVDFLEAFDEYAQMKLGSAKLASYFSRSKLMRFLAQVAPGFRDLVLIGKAWQMRDEFDHIVMDMPATGHSITMFQSTLNFRRAFAVGPLARDTDQMLETFASPERCASLILALPEETPLIEGLELGEKLQSLFPKVVPHYVMNRVWQKEKDFEEQANIPLIPRSAHEFLSSKYREEDRNRRLWTDRGVPFVELPRLSPPPLKTPAPAILELAERLERYL